jgi:hypothetical protein
MKRWIAVSALAAFLAACGNQCNHHECDVDTFASHCDDNGNLVSCQDETTGEGCVLSEGCDTYVTTTACACLPLTSSSAVCEDEDAGHYDGGGRTTRDAGHVDASEDSGDDDASDADVVDDAGGDAGADVADD